MAPEKKIILGMAAVVLLIANTIVVIYGTGLVKFNTVNLGIDTTSPDIFGLGWFFWFFVLLTMVFNATFVITVVDELRSNR